MPTFLVNADGLTVIPSVPDHAGLQSVRANGKDSSLWVRAFGNGNECTANLISYMAGRMDANGVPGPTKVGSNVYFSGLGAAENGIDVFFGSIGWEATQDFTTGSHSSKFYMNYMRPGSQALTRWLCIDDGGLHLVIDELYLHRPDAGGVKKAVDGDVTLPDGTILTFWSGICVAIQPPE